MPFSSNLEYLMGYFDVTNYRLAKYLGVSQTSVKNWVSGERLPHYQTQKMIADLFGVTVEDLVGDKLPHITGQNMLPFQKKGFLFYGNFLKACNSVGKKPTAVLLDLGIGRSAGTRWKNGQQPTDAILQKLADYFGISPAELLAGEKSPPPDGDELPDVWYQLSDEGREKAMEYMDFLKAQQDKR